MLAALSIASMAGATPSEPHLILGPSGYSQGNDQLIVAGSQTPTLGSGDQVVICHATGMTNKDAYVQNAPSAGVVFGHAGSDHQSGEDIIPPFVYDKGNSTDTSLSGGQNWTSEGRLIYEHGCTPPDPVPASLTVVKHVVGGTAEAADFTVDVDAGAAVAPFAGSEAGTTVSIPAGAYSVGEHGGPAHYVGSKSEGCEGTVAEGASVTCTITNTYVPPEPTNGTIVVEKRTIPAGSDQDFPFSVVPSVVRNNELLGESFALNPVAIATASHSVDVAAGWYTITEGSVAGWELASVSCSNDDGARAVGPAEIHVHEGSTVTCVFTNEKQPVPASLKVVKHVVGGTAEAGDFTVDVNAAGTSADVSFSGSETGTTVSIPAGAYSVGEHGGPAHYEASKSEGCEGTVAEGASVTCTITNTYRSEPPVTTTTTTQTTTESVTPTLIAPVPVAVDLTVTKTDWLDPVVVGGELHYTITVFNTPPKNGPAFTATDVTLTDPLPAGVVYVEATPSQGTCTIGAERRLVCKLGSIEPGDLAVVVVTVRPTSPGLLTNTAVAIAAEPEANTADNSATETTTVRGPFKPPVVLRCTALSVRPISLQVGHRKTVVVLVRDQSGKPLAGAVVTVRGPGVNVRGTTSKAGIYRHVFQPKKPGVLVVRALPGAAGKCLGRVGVVGIFQPPVTG